MTKIIDKKLELINNPSEKKYVECTYRVILAYSRVVIEEQQREVLEGHWKMKPEKSREKLSGGKERVVCGMGETEEEIGWVIDWLIWEIRRKYRRDEFLCEKDMLEYGRILYGLCEGI